MVRPLNKNLNTVPYWEKETYRTDKRKYKTHEHFHYRGETKIAGKENDVQKCKKCHRILLSRAFTAGKIRGDGSYFLVKACRECRSEEGRNVAGARKKATPKPDRCNCCHKKVEKIQLDHLHGTSTFRGWLCRDCNTGIGSLGDNLRGVLQGAIYLENDTNKIIETLHKVFNEMFARAND